MKWTRQRCHVALKMFAIAALRPTCESEITSLTLCKPRRLRLRKNSVQNGSASLGPVAGPKSSCAVRLDAEGYYHSDGDIRLDVRTFTYFASIRRYGQNAFDRPMEKRLDPFVDLAG